MKNKIKDKLRLPHLSVIIRILLYIVTIVVAVFSLYIANQNAYSETISIITYVLSAVLFFSTCYYIVCDILHLKEMVLQFMKQYPFLEKLLKDYRYRTIIFTGTSFLLNFAFAVYNGILGLIQHSVWFAFMWVYYIVLSVMSYLVIKYEEKTSRISESNTVMQKELSVREICGGLLFLVTILLGGIVILIWNKEGGKEYPCYLIFVVALYTFYKIIVSIINMIKAGKMKSPLLMTIRNIGYADAVVSILSLQTAMFASFEKEKSVDINWMNSVTGSIGCIMIGVMGIYMVISSAKQKKQMKTVI